MNIKLKRPLQITIFIAVLAITLSTAIYAGWNNLTVRNSGSIIAIGVVVHWDPNQQNETTEINWGTIWTGSTKNVTIYITSISNRQTHLHLESTNWTPKELEKYMTLSWTYTGQLIDPGDTIQVTLKLSCSSSSEFFIYLMSNNIEDFNFDVIISAEKA